MPSLLGYRAGSTCAEWVRYHPGLKTNRGSSRVNHPAIIVGDTLGNSYSVTTACKLGWKEAKWVLMLQI